MKPGTVPNKFIIIRSLSGVSYTSAPHFMSTPRPVHVIRGEKGYLGAAAMALLPGRVV